MRKYEKLSHYLFPYIGEDLEKFHTLDKEMPPYKLTSSQLALNSMVIGV